MDKAPVSIRKDSHIVAAIQTVQRNRRLQCSNLHALSRPVVQPVCCLLTTSLVFEGSSLIRNCIVDVVTHELLSGGRKFPVVFAPQEESTGWCIVQRHSLTAETVLFRACVEICSNYSREADTRKASVVCHQMGRSRRMHSVCPLHKRRPSQLLSSTILTAILVASTHSSALAR